MRDAPPPPIRRINFDLVDSTSLHARRLVESGGAGDGPLLITARTQSGGVGRLGRPWSSPAGGLWMTLVWPPRTSACQPGTEWRATKEMPGLVEGLGLRIGIAVTEAVRAAVGAADAPRLMLKWPNDVLLDGRKVCGVLTELVGSGEGLRVVVGIGVNLNFDADRLPEELLTRATTVRAALGRDFDPEIVLAALLERIAPAIDGPWPDAALVGRANAMLWGVGSEHECVLNDGTPTTGELIGLDGRGVPVVRTAEGIGRLPTTAI